MSRKMLNLIAAAVICTGGATAMAKAQNHAFLLMAKCESTDGKKACECKGGCSAGDTDCSCD